MIIYRIYNKATGGNYIGQTSQTLRKRIYNHLHNKSSLVGQAMREQGLKNFDVSVIDICQDREDADKAEAFGIDFYDAIATGYNVMQGGAPDKAYMDKLRQMPRTEKSKKRKKRKIIPYVVKKPTKEMLEKRAERFKAKEAYPSQKDFAQAETELIKSVMCRQVILNIGG